MIEVDGHTSDNQYLYEQMKNKLKTDYQFTAFCFVEYPKLKNK